MALGTALFRTKSLANNNVAGSSVYVNIEAHSIAFTCLCLWIIPAVMLGSVIGVSQSESSFPSILRRFEIDMMHVNMEMAKRIKALNECLGQTETRKVCGGIFSWQPGRLHTGSRRHSNPDSEGKGLEIERKDRGIPKPGCRGWLSMASPTRIKRSGGRSWLPHIIMLTGTAASLLISGYVPPDGIDCRQIAQAVIVSVWLVSALLDQLLIRIFPINSFGPNKALFWFTYAKDFIATGLTMGGIIITQVGILNRPVCWTQWGRTGLALPQADSIARILNSRLEGLYPIITVTAIVVEFLLVPVLVWWRYRSALRIFVQRDDGNSNDIWDLKRRCSEVSGITHNVKCKYCSLPKRQRWRERKGWIGFRKDATVRQNAFRESSFKSRRRMRTLITRYSGSERDHMSSTISSI